jgi:diguanylate cyclase (GGDEF)-like protein
VPASPSGRSRRLPAVDQCVSGTCKRARREALKCAAAGSAAFRFYASSLISSARIRPPVPARPAAVSPRAERHDVHRASTSRSVRLGHPHRERAANTRQIVRDEVRTPSEPDRQIVLQIALIAIGYGLALAEIHAGATGVTRWTIVVMMVTVVATVVHLLKRQSDGLVFDLNRAAYTDAITGLVNRRGFDRQLELELQRAARLGSTVALVLCDLDHLKLVNDTFGHAAGDAALAAVADTLRTGVRQIDTLARIGGDEFALLLPGSTAQDGHKLAARLSDTVSQLRDPGSNRLSASFCVTEFPPRRHNNHRATRQRGRIALSRQTITPHPAPSAHRQSDTRVRIRTLDTHWTRPAPHTRTEDNPRPPVSRTHQTPPPTGPSHRQTPPRRAQIARSTLGCTAFPAQLPIRDRPLPALCGTHCSEGVADQMDGNEKGSTSQRTATRAGKIATTRTRARASRTKYARTGDVTNVHSRNQQIALSSQKPPSPLTDSNRRPLPYHGGPGLAASYGPRRFPC